MTEWLIKRFVPNYTETTEVQTRTKYALLANAVGLVCNFLLLLSKIIVAFFTGSLALFANAVDNLADFTSNIASAIGFKLAERPADEEHPYGHGRYEYLAGLVVAVFVLFIGFEIVRSAISRLFNPEPVAHSAASIFVLLLSIVVKLWMYSFYKKISELIESTTLKANAVDSRSDVWATLAVLVAVIIYLLTDYDIDAHLSLVVGILIVIDGIKLVGETVSPILGESICTKKQDEMLADLMSYPEVLAAHDMLVHDYGPQQVFASVHIDLPAEMSTYDSHEIIDEIEKDFWAKYKISLIIHIDPVFTDARGLPAKDQELAYLNKWLNAQVQDFDPELNVHGVKFLEPEAADTAPAEELKSCLFAEVVLSAHASYTAQELETYLQNKLSENNIPYELDLHFEYLQPRLEQMD